MNKKLNLCLITLISCFIQISLLSYGSTNYSLKEALKVLNLIEKIQLEQSRSTNGKLRRVTVTESELNSYIAFRIETEKEEIMKQLNLHIQINNRIEGSILIDLRGQNVPDFLRPQMNLYFGGRVEVKEKKVRINIKKLFIEDIPIQPEILDVIIQIASKIENSEPTSLYDWYDLPFGIKDIKTQNGKAIFYY